MTLKPRGRPSDYDENYHPEMAFKLCLLGSTDKQMADVFGITEQTLNNWKKDHPDFFESLKKGKEVADAEISKSLYHRAKGYEHEDLYITQHQGKIITRKIIKRYPPDATSMIFWLKNRHPEKWRDRQETALTGPNGGPVAFELLLQDIAAQPGTVAEAPAGYGAGAFLPPGDYERSTAAPDPADGNEPPPERDTGAGVDCSAAGTNEDDDDGDSDE